MLAYKRKRNNELLVQRGCFFAIDAMAKIDEIGI